MCGFCCVASSLCSHSVTRWRHGTSAPPQAPPPGAALVVRLVRETGLSPSDHTEVGVEPVQHTPLSYTNWYAGQPDNAGGFEDCMEINYKTPGKWNDPPCTEKREVRLPAAASAVSTEHTLRSSLFDTQGYRLGQRLGLFQRITPRRPVDCGWPSLSDDKSAKRLTRSTPRFTHVCAL